MISLANQLADLLQDVLTLRLTDLSENLITACAWSSDGADDIGDRRSQSEDPNRSMAPTTYAGTLLGESLRVGAVLDEVPFSVKKIFRAASGDVGAGQPKDWIFIEFEVAAERAMELADMLSRTLNKPWRLVLRFPIGRRGIRGVCRPHVPLFEGQHNPAAKGRSPCQAHGRAGGAARLARLNRADRDCPDGFIARRIDPISFSHRHPKARGEQRLC